MAFSIKLARKLLVASNKAYKSAKSRKIDEVVIRGAALEPSRMVDISRGSKRYDTEFFVTANKAGDIVVAFRGSETDFFKKNGAWRDWILTDFDAKPETWPRCPTINGNRVYVHRGIWIAYDAVAKDLKKAVAKLLGQKYSRQPRILVTGHSLGGALAQFAAADLGTWFPKVGVVVYTFASPRVGDADFGGYLVRHTKGAHQVINRGDPVPYVPPVGPNIWARKDKKYRTAGKTHYLRGKGVLRPAPKMAAALNPMKHKASAYLKEIDLVIAKRDPAAAAAAKKAAKKVKQAAEDVTTTAKKSVARAKSKAKKTVSKVEAKAKRTAGKLFGKMKKAVRA